MVRWLIVVCMSVLMAGTAFAQRPDETRAYDIPPMSLKKALGKLARKADLSIAYDDLPMKGYRSGYVFGEIGARDALAMLLSNSPYGFEFVGPDTVRLTLIKKPAAKAAETDGSSYDGRDSIVVTATKREAYAQTLPVSISAISGDTLRLWGARDFDALAPALAGVAFTNLGPSRNKIFLRGISDGSFADRTQLTVGVYLDDTPIIFNDTNPDLRLIDVDRVEVVRGPQGSLYGNGSIGGVIRIITNKPDLHDYSGRVRAAASGTEDGGANATFDGAVNLPLVPGRLGVRASGYYEKASGYIDDVALGVDDVNESAIYGGRLAVRATLSQRWMLDVAANVQSVDLADTQYVFEDLGGLRRANSEREPYSDEFRHFSITATGELDNAKVTSSSAFIDRDTTSVFDATAALPALIGDADAKATYRTNDAIRSFNHETRIVSDNGGEFNWLAGVYFARRTEDIGARLIVDSVSPISLPFFSTRRDSLWEGAFFGEASYKLRKDLTLTAGLRWSYTNYQVHVDSGGSVNAGPEVIDDSRTRTSLTPKLSLSYQPTDTVMVYVLTARGTRIGGFNVNTPLAALTPIASDEEVDIFEPDELWNTELGVKSSWFDGDLVLNAAAFYVRWSRIQTDQILPNGFSYIANAGKARNYGFEVEANARPFRFLEIAAALSVNNPELTRANPFLGAQVGDTLPNIAAVTGSIAAAIEVPLADQWTGRFSADYRYIGRSYLTFAEEAAPRMGDYQTGDLRASARRERLNIGVFADNFWNSHGDTFAFGNPFSLASEKQATPIRPRTIGAFVEVDF